MKLDVHYEIEIPILYEQLFHDCLLAVEVESSPQFRDTEISLVIVDEEQIQRLNKQYRGKDAVTDVLSFPHWQEAEELVSGSILGEVFLCYPRVVYQAEELEHSIAYELATLLIHGLWHLQGYDHIVEEDFQVMHEKEKTSLKTVTENSKLLISEESISVKKEM